MQTISEIPESHIAELTGNVGQNDRKQHYDAARVFFMTPQTLQNDLEKGVFKSKRITLLVIDEAHRATKNYAYCTVIK